MLTFADWICLDLLGDLGLLGMIGFGDVDLVLFGGVGDAFLLLLLLRAIRLLTREQVYLAIRVWVKVWILGLRTIGRLGGLGDGVICVPVVLEDELEGCVPDGPASARSLAEGWK